jgi:hypothetical protein
MDDLLRFTFSGLTFAYEISTADLEIGHRRRLIGPGGERDGIPARAFPKAGMPSLSSAFLRTAARHL